MTLQESILLIQFGCYLDINSNGSYTPMNYLISVKRKNFDDYLSDSNITFKD